MNRIITIASVLALVGTTDAMGQARPPTQVGFYTGATVQRGVERLRVGMNYSWRLIGVIEAYPGLEIFPQDLGSSSVWQLNLDLRVWPLRRGTNRSFWFVGAGAVATSDELSPALITGLTTAVGNLTPFIQFQVYGSSSPFDSRADLTGGFLVTFR